LRTLFLTFLFSITLLFAGTGDENLKIKILKKIVSGIHNSDSMKLWSDDYHILKAFSDDDVYHVTMKCESADIIILKEKENLPSYCVHQHIFVLSYKLLNDIPKSFGAFFWKKGRPNIVFIEPRVKENSLELSIEMKPYVEEKVW